MVRIMVHPQGAQQWRQEVRATKGFQQVPCLSGYPWVGLPPPPLSEVRPRLGERPRRGHLGTDGAAFTQPPAGDPDYAPDAYSH